MLSKPLPDWLEARVADMAAELDLRVKVLNTSVSLSLCLFTALVSLLKGHPVSVKISLLHICQSSSSSSAAAAAAATIAVAAVYIAVSGCLSVSVSVWLSV